ncbi:MAG: hypothetical protein LAT50_21420 [Ectothiorhodospiraceae bacterium]|nr:hypothetical protein [Ectothiorhodospiraceae bacterium]
MQYRQGFCSVCDKPSKLERKGTNHVLHLLITLVLGALTFWAFFIGGILWLFIWFGLSVKIGGWRCHQCGGKKVATSIPKGWSAQ